MKNVFLFTMTLFFANIVYANIWRVNNNAGVNANFTTLTAAVASSSVLNGDTIHVEPSATAYSFPTINKSLVIIGNGYLLSGSTGNTGLQDVTINSSVAGFRFASGSAGTRIIGLDITASSDFASGYSGSVNITIEKCKIAGTILSFASGATYSGVTFRKCFFGVANFGSAASVTALNNFTIENCIMSNSNVFSPFSLKPPSGTNIIIRNNTFNLTANPAVDVTNAYFANNIILSGTNQNVFVNSNVKNNIFTANQTGITVGPLSTNGNNLTSQTLTSIIVNTGSDDGKFQLAASSPAIGGGVDIGGTKPDCGAFGGTDPYKLSGIPGIPSIYSFSVPNSIPLGTATMNVSISTRNNN